VHTEEQQARREPNGFTLIEVLVAMIILAVGLLGLEALAIGAARSVAHAQQRTVMAAAATQEMEDRMQALRNNPGAVANATECRTENEDTIEICTTISAAGLPAGSRRVTVAVERQVGEPLPYSISSYVFAP
jgi:type IV pilus modification protein PilV